MTIQVDADSLVEQILPYEREFFFMLNGSDNIFMDSFMWIYSSKFTWIPLAIVALAVFVYKVKWQKALLFVLCTALLFTLCDQISAGVIKPIFERFRPTHHPDFSEAVKVVNNYRGGRFGFVSAHAANGFGIAMFISLIFRYRRLTITVFSWALITCYSRVYLGVHFISDVIGGMLLGALLGFLVYLLYQYCSIHILKCTVEESKISPYSTFRANVLCTKILVLVASIIVISLMNFMYGYHWLY